MRRRVKGAPVRSQEVGNPYKATVSWELPVARAPRWSVTATNLLDNKVATFVGVPKIGRLLLTRLQYTY